MFGFKDTKLKGARKRSRNGSVIQDTTIITKNLNFNETSEINYENDEETKFKKIPKDEKPALLDELEEEIERQLESKARKNNLSVSNVKNIIKAVITSQDVLTLMDFNLNMSEEKPPYEPKLTRAKTRELLGTDSNSPTNGSPKKTSDIVELINQELPDDSSDEEYCPLEDGTDEESKFDDSFIEEELFGKVAFNTIQTENLESNLNFDDSIGQRTRSKLCLSKTPLEAIEQAFVPPDITTDMYATTCENQDWVDFLKEFTQPFNASEQNEHNDDDNDSEYNVMVDEEFEGTDREELRMDRAVKVSKKELNALMTECFEYNAAPSEDEENPDMKSRMVDKVEDQEKLQQLNGHPLGDNSDFSVNSSFKSKLCNETSAPILVREEVVIFKEQRLLLRQQICQHVQLLLTNFLLSFGHPGLDESYATKFKEMLVTWNIKNQMNENNEKWLKIVNLKPSMDLVSKWEKIINDPDKKSKIQKFLNQQMELVEYEKKKKVIYKPEIPKELIRICRDSQAFMYPLMLPSFSFKSTHNCNKGLLPSEINLIACGFQDYVLQNGGQFNITKDLTNVVDYITKFKVPNWSKSTIRHFIRRTLRTDKMTNSVKAFVEGCSLPVFKHFVIPMPNRLLKLYEHSPVLLPEQWRLYLKRLSNLKFI